MHDGYDAEGQRVSQVAPAFQNAWIASAATPELYEFGYPERRAPSADSPDP